MDRWNDLEPAVKQGLILLAGVLGGIILTMIAQGFASRRSTKAALKLFERQTGEQHRIAAEGTLDRRQRAQVDQRQEAYARFMSLAWQYEQASADVLAAQRETEKTQRDTERARDTERTRDTEKTQRDTERTGLEWIGAKADLLRTATTHQAHVRDELSQARELVRLLAPAPVRFAADRWFIDLTHGEPTQAHRAKSEFLQQARLDVGADEKAHVDEDTRPR